MVLLHRQRAILSMVNQNGGKVEKLRLIKLAFLLRQAGIVERLPSFYSFVPYHHGPFSFVMSYELEKLFGLNYLQEANKIISITDTGRKASKTAQAKVQTEVGQVVSRWNEVSTSKLVNEVFELYPRYSLNYSQKETQRADSHLSEQTVFTSGYEGLQVDEFFDQLVASGVRVVVDTRSNPISRRYGFHRKTIKGIAEKLGFDYFHEPSLGIPSKWRRNLKNYEDYQHIFDRYRSEILPGEKPAVSRVVNIAKTKPTVIICSEADCKYCHRSELAQLVSKKSGLEHKELRVVG